MKVTRFTVDDNEVLTVEIPKKELVGDDDVYLHFRKFAFEWEFLNLRKKWESVDPRLAALGSVRLDSFPPTQDDSYGQRD